MTNDEIDLAPLQAAPLLEPGGGPRLRREREARGLTVADVSGHLKVAPKRIEAIEAGAWETLLPLPYLRGFVRNYAKLVQVDVAPILAEIDASLGRAPDAELPSLEPAPQLHEPFFDRARMHTRGWRLGRGLLLGAIVIVVAVVAVWLGSRSFETRLDQARNWWISLVPGGVTTAPDAAQPRDGRIEQPLPAPISHPLTTVPDGNVVPAAPAPAPAPAPALAPAQSLPEETFVSKLVMRFADESWVQVRQRDGKILLSQLNPPHSEQVLAGIEPFELVIGNPTAVTLMFRGEPVDLTPHVRQNVARVILK